MSESLFLAIGILLGFLFALTVTLLLSLYSKPASHQALMPIEILKRRVGTIRTELQSLEEQLWVYGVAKEEENKKWRRSYRDFANKTINSLHSCWIGKDEDATAKATYSELITGLKTIGIEEIIPEIGENIDETDKRFSFRVIGGKPPFVVARLVYPGYKLNSSQLGETIILSQAVIEVIGKE